MSDHGTHHLHHDGDHHAEPKSKTSFRASFWLVLILVGLFIAALNFISVMGHEEGGHEATTEHQHGGAPATHEAAGHAGTPEHGSSHEDQGAGAAPVHTTGSADHSAEGHRGTTSDSAAHH
jgi:hypothetical protein